MNGLREDIQLRLRSHETTKLYKTMKLAREIEAEVAFFDKACADLENEMEEWKRLKLKTFSHRLNPRPVNVQPHKPTYGMSINQRKDGSPPKPPENSS